MDREGNKIRAIEVDNNRIVKVRITLASKKKGGEPEQDGADGGTKDGKRGDRVGGRSEGEEEQ